MKILILTCTFYGGKKFLNMLWYKKISLIMKGE